MHPDEGRRPGDVRTRKTTHGKRSKTRPLNQTQRAVTVIGLDTRGYTMASAACYLFSSQVESKPQASNRRGEPGIVGAHPPLINLCPPARLSRVVCYSSCCTASSRHAFRYRETHCTLTKKKKFYSSPINDAVGLPDQHLLDI